MAALGSQSIASSYEQLLHVDRDGGGNTTTHVSLKDGDNGTTFGFTIATDALMMTSTNRLEFGDTGTYIHQSADGVLDLVSDTEIELTATTIDINGAVAMDGAMTGGTNITISGELDAATLDISGNADIDGTMEADAITIGGVTLAETIADTVGAMVSSNTETGIAVTYEDGDNTLDFVLGAAQTTVTSLLAADIKIGEDNETKIDFETPNEIHLYANNVEQVYVADNIFGPNADSDVDLGTTGERWKDAFVDSITVTGEIDGASLDIEGNADINGTTNLDAVDIDGAVQIDNTVTVGVNDAGHDVIYYGNAAGALAMWDASADSFLVRGATADAAGSSGTIVLQTAQVAVEDGDILGRIDFNSPLESSGSDAISVGASIYAEADGTFASGANATELVFGTTTNGAATEKMRITSAGNIGIGTASSQSPLQLGRVFGLAQDANSGYIGANFGDSTGGNYIVSQFANQIHFDSSAGKINFRTAVSGTAGNSITYTTAKTIDSVGNVTMPKQPAFQVIPSSAQENFAENSAVTIGFGSERFDQGGNFASNTFTAPVTGKYQMNVKIYLKNLESAYDYYELQIVSSNKTYYALFDLGGSGDPLYWVNQEAALVDMDANDTCQIKIQAGGTGGGADHDIDTHSVWSGFLAC